MTRRRARRTNVRNGSIKNILSLSKSIPSRMTIKIISTWHATASNNLVAFTGRDSTLHPNYAYNNGSIDGSTLLGSIVQSTTTVGLFKNLIVKRVKLILHVSNLDSVPKEVNILPIPWNNTGASGLGNDSNVNLKSRQDCVSFLISKLGVTGDTKTLVVSFDCDKIEGLNISNQPLYWATNTARGSQYSNYYLQTWSLDYSSTCTNGVIISARAEYDCDLLQSNTNLNA